jgi:acetylglutamate kinase
MSASEPQTGHDIIVVKVGGSTLGTGDSTTPDIVELARRRLRPVVVHGGGKTITEWVGKQGIQPEFVRGLRKTNKATLDVAIAVLCGLINAQLVSEIIAAGGNAVGLSGVSGGMLKAVLQDPELGLVGRVVKADPAVVLAVLNAGAIPVIAPTALHMDPSPDASDLILNVNADTSAGHIARALKACRLVFQTDVEGVLDSRRRVIPQMTRRQARDLIASGVAGGGMIPKIEACADALETVGSGHIIDGRMAGALLACAEGEPTGTRIV